MEPRAAFLAELELALPEQSASARAKLADYLRLVDEYSAVLDLTAFAGSQQLAAEYAFAPARLGRAWPLPAAGLAADLGSGAGCPVVALATLFAGWEFSAVESRARRAAFLATVRARLGLDNLEILRARTEALIAAQPRSFDLVTARAYAKPPVLLAQAAALLRPGGELRAIVPLDGPDDDWQRAGAGAFSLEFAEAGYGRRGWRFLRALRL